MFYDAFFCSFINLFNLIFMKNLNCSPNFKQAIKNNKPFAVWFSDPNPVKFDLGRTRKEIIKEALEKMVSNSNVGKRVD